MAGPNLPTNIAAGGTTTGHKAHTDTVHTYVDKLDTTFLTPTLGKVLTANGTTWAPADPTSGDIIIREIGDTSIPGGTPAGTLLFTKLPITLKKWDGVGVEDGATVTTSTVGSGDSIFSAVASTPTVTASEIVIANAASASNVAWDGFNRSQFGLRFYFRNDALSSGNANILAVTDLTAVVLFKISINTSNQPQLRNTASTSIWNGTAMTIGKTYRFEVAKTGASTVTVKVYTLAGTIHTQSGSQTITTSSDMDKIVIGRENSVAYGPGHFSHLAVVDTAVDVGAYPSAIF